MKKVKKINELKQVHGKDERPEFQPTTLEQILGDTGIGKYRTMDAEIYEASLNDMNKSDLQTHAAKFGIIPIDDRNRLTARLVTEFKKHVASYRRPDNIRQPVKASKEVLAILAQGR